MRLWFMLIWLAVPACGSESRAPGSFEHLAMVASQELRVGSPNDPERAFTWFRQLEVGADGTIFTAHPQESQIRVHDASGSFVHSIGRKGEGPGEFDRIGEMAIVGDTLWVLDHGLYRFSYFDVDGNLLRMRRIPVDLGNSPTELPPRPRGLLRDGTIIGAPPAFSRMVASGELTENYLVRMDTSGTPIDTIATYSLVNTTWEITNNERGPAYFGSYRTQPFSDTEIVSVSEYEMIAVRVTRRLQETEDAAAFTVTAWQIDGDTIFSRAFPYDPISLRTTIVDSIVDGFAQDVASSDFVGGRATLEEAARWAREGLYLPPYHPPVSSVLLASDGRVWLRGEELGEPMSTWRILSASGEPVGIVELPSGFTMLYARDLQAWGIEYDELDVPYIVRYQLTEPPTT